MINIFSISKICRSQTQGLIAVNIAAMISGSAALYGKLDVSPIWIVAMRAIFAALALGVLGIFKGKLIWPERRLIPLIILTGCILALHWLTFFISVQQSGVAIATLTFAVFPLFTVLIQTIMHHRWPRLFELISGAVIIVAVKLIVSMDLGDPSKLMGTLAGLGSALAFAWFGIASKKLTKSFSSLLISFYQNLVVAAVLVPILPFIAQGAPHAGDWIWLMLLGIFTTAVMHQLYFFALQRLSASICSGFVALEPVYAVLFAAIFFHEPVTYWVMISGLLILAASGLLLYYDEEIVSEYKTEEL